MGISAKSFELRAKTRLAFAALAAGLLCTVLAGLQARQAVERDALAAIAFAADQMALKVHDRLIAHALVLQGAAALFGTSSPIERRDWHAYIETLQAERSMPGVQGIGFAKVIAAEHLATHILHTRGDGFPEYTVSPAGERAVYTSIVYLEPFRGRNLRAFGFDMYSEPIRRAAMERSRDTGEATLSGKVELVQETGVEIQAGTLMYVPVYRSDLPSATPAQRTAALIGWAYIPYRMTDLMAGILGDWKDPARVPYDLHVYDGLQATPAAMLFDSCADRDPLLNSRFRQQRTIDFNGHPWLLALDNGAAAPGANYASVWQTLAVGLALSWLMFLWARATLNTRNNALRIAGELTETVRCREQLLKESEARFRTMADCAPVLIWTAGLDKLCQYFNKVWLEFTGRPIEQELGNGWAEGVHPEDFECCLATYTSAFDARRAFTMEYRLRRFDGEYRWLVDNGVPRYDGEGAFIGYIGSCIDVTEHRRIEETLRVSKALLADNASEVIWTMDLQGRHTYVSPSVERLRGYCREDVMHQSLEQTLTPASAPIAAQAFGRAIEAIHAGQPVPEFRGELEQSCKHGGSVWTEVSISAMRDAAGECVGLLGVARDVTERRRAQAAALEGAQIHRTAMETSRDGFFIADLEGRLLEVNGAYLRMSGYAREELIGMRFADFDASESGHDIARCIENCVAMGGDLFETLHRKKDGSLWQVEINAHYAPVAGGRLFVFARDIRQRKHVESLKKMQLGFSEVMLHGSLDDLLRAILDAAERLTGSRIGFFHFVDPDQEHVSLQVWSSNTVAHMCRAANKERHYPISEAGVWVDCVKARKPVIHNDFASLAHRKGLPEGHAPVIRELTVPILRGGRVVALIGVGNKPDLYSAQDEATVDELAGMASDMVDAKRAQTELRDSEARLQVLFEYSPVSIWEEDLSALKTRLDALRREGVGDWRAYFDAHPEQVSRCIASTRLLDVNQTGVRFFGGRSKQEIVHTAHDFFPPESMNALKEEVIALAEGRIHCEGDMLVQALDGRKKSVSRRLAIVPGAEQSWTRVLVSFVDLSEHERLEQASRQTQRLQSLGTLAGGIAHDFNNILTAIRGNADLAAADVGDDHPAAQSLTEIRKAGARASELVRRIAAFGRPRSAERAVVDMEVVLCEVLKLLRATLPASLALQQEIAQGTPHVLADAGQLHEAIVNLTTNAAYAIGPRAGSIVYRLEPVQVGADRAASMLGLKQGRFARLTVTDSGCGMDTATQERIFDAYFTTKPPGEGTGLGLSMVHGTMQSHGGVVAVNSAPCHGASFALYFPAAEMTAPKEDRDVAPEFAVTAGHRVLYVDDEEALVNLANRALSRRGYRIRGFTDPGQALAAFRAHPQDYDAMVTDLSMPQMSGFELAHEVLALRPGMPVLMISGYIRARDEEKAHAVGIRRLMHKPVTIEELARVLDAELRGDANDAEARTTARTGSIAGP